VVSLRSSTVHVETNDARVRWIRSHAQTPQNMPVMCLTCEFLLCFCLVQGKAVERKFLVPWGGLEVWQRSKQKPLEIRHLGTAGEQRRVQCYVSVDGHQASSRVEGTQAQ